MLNVLSEIIYWKTCVEGTLWDQFGFGSSGGMTREVLEKAIGFNLKCPKENILFVIVTVYLEDILEHTIPTFTDANAVTLTVS